jgi:hypothetical protein
MQIECSSVTAIQGRYDKGLATYAKSDVSEKSRVQDSVDRFPVVRSSVGDSAELTSTLRIHRLPVSGP